MVRKFYKTDLERVMEIWLEANIDCHDFIQADYWKSNYPIVKEEILKADLCVYETEGKVQGFIGIQGEYLAGIFVDKGFRSMGIGHHLLECAKADRSCLSLNVYKKNTRAIGFYQREGFCVVSENPEKETGQTDLTMLWHRPGTRKTAGREEGRE